MISQVFIEEEKGTLITQPEEWAEKVKELDLKGQQKFLEGGTEVSKSIIPFRKLSPEEVRVLRCLLPVSTSVETYSREPIPIKCLSAVALARKERYFRKIVVWCNEHEPDPVIVGLPEGKYDWYDTDWFILAQWGPEAISFEAMREKAIKRLEEKLSAAGKNALAKLQSILAPDSLRFNVLNYLEKGEKIEVAVEIGHER